MKIIIVGIGNVGERLLADLSEEDHSITVVDKNNAVVERPLDTYDCNGICGNCVSIEILRAAEADVADLIIACSPYDETNILCCMVAKKLGTRQTIARVRNPEYFSLFKDTELGLNMMVNPEYETAKEISRLLRFPSAIKMEPFAAGKVELVEIKVLPGSPFDGVKLMDLQKNFSVKMVVCAIERDERVIIPNGNDVLQAGDSVHLTSSPQNIIHLFRNLGVAKSAKRILIAGGSRTAYFLTKELKNHNVSVKIIESDEKRCEELEEELPNAEIIHGEAGEQEVLTDEGLTDYDAFISLGETDEKNIVTALYASGQGVKKVIAKADKPYYAELVQNKGVECIVSVYASTVNEILRYIRGQEGSKAGQFNKLYRIIDNQVEILEFTVSDGFNGIGKPIKNLTIQRDVLIAAIIRKSELIIPGGDDVILTGDTVLVVTTNEYVGDLNDILE